ncbi:MAG TPA: M24 family metallopeptidase [Candidatus Tectomicrobia bacterium]|nr:M24 family metallopeptidase [Candidatus Tectomicrobia bacterium]
MMDEPIRAIQDALRQAAVDGWLFADFRGSDPLAYRILKLSNAGMLSRRWFYYLPATGEPRKLVHRIESHSLDLLPGRSVQYASWHELHAQLKGVLAGSRRVAMQYSPQNAIPYVSRVDAGTIELVRSFGIEVVTSADLVQCFEAVWTPEQWEAHQYAARALRTIIDETFGHLRETVTNHGEVSEHAVQQFILGRFESYSMRSDKPPIVAVNAHSADPHFQPTPTSGLIRRGDFVLLDIWAKRKESRSVYADITWTGYLGEAVPELYRNIFRVVQRGRDAAIDFVQDAVHAGRAICGWEVDDMAREAIRKAGYAEYFIHRTGHSIGEEVHGNGANIDNYESRDERHLLPRTCFSIEPGVYLPGQFGVRSEVDMYVSEHGAFVTGQPIQLGVVPILAML